LTLPAEVVDSTVELRVNLTPSPGSAAFGALDYLVGYPYGCTEQTMSRFLPCVLVQRTVQALGKGKEGKEGERGERGEGRDNSAIRPFGHSAIRPFGQLPSSATLGTLGTLGTSAVEGAVTVRADLPALVRAGLKRLYNLQHPDGGWGWWEYDSSDGYTTAYVVYGLTEAKAAGYDIEPGRIDRALRFLRGKLAVMQKEKLPDESTPRKEIEAKPERSRRLAEQVYVMYALSLHRSVPDAAFNFVYQEKVRDDLNDYSRALFAMALHHHGRKKQAEKVLAELQAHGVQEKGRCYWKAPTDQWGWTDNDIETTAYALRAFLQIDPDNPLCGRIANWLVLHRENGYYWESTKDTAAAVFALADYLRVRREIAPPNYTARVLVNGEEIGRLTVTPDDVVRPDESFTVLRDKVRDGENEVRMVKEGEGDLFYSLSLRFYGLEEDMPARSGGLTVERRYYQLMLMEGAEEGQEFIRQELAGEVRSGQQVEVALQIKADADYEYLIIEDPFPAGFEPVDYRGGDESGEGMPWYCRREAHDDRMAFFATRLDAGEHTLAYRLRAQIPGDFHTLPARAYGMYAPRIGGNSAETRVTVK
jgi:uncharacterized protein YfaS (alpha-2-macroglobulin family)